MYGHRLQGVYKLLGPAQCSVIHEATCAEVKKASQRTAELERNASEENEKTRSHRERSRRLTDEHTRSEAAVSHSLGFLGWRVKETSRVAYPVVKVTRCVISPGMADAFQGVQPETDQTSEHEEAVPVERQRWNTAVSFLLRCDN